MSLLEEVLAHLHDVAIGYDVPLIEDINIEVIAGDAVSYTHLTLPTKRIV